MRYPSPLPALLCLLLLLLASSIPSLAASPEQTKPQVMDGPVITLRASGINEFTRVAAPSRTRYAPKSATINVAFTGDWPEEAKSAFNYAKGIWETQLTSAVPISVTASWEDLGSPLILGSAGPKSTHFGDSPPPGLQANTWYPFALANAIIGSDAVPSEPDITSRFNSARLDWYFGTDGQTPVGQIDFVSVVLHELGHGLGFSGSMEVSGGQGTWGYAGFAGIPDIYDRFTINGGAARLLDFTSPSSELATELQGGNLFFDGSNATAANGGSAPKLYAPNPFEPGSSYSHLDEALFPAGNPNSLMTPSLGSAEAIHDTGAITRGIFRDLGWTVTEPGITTPTPTPTVANTSTATPTPFDTNTPTPELTHTPTATGTLSPTPTPFDTNTPTSTPIGTQSPTATPTNTNTPTQTATGTLSPTATLNATNTLTPLGTATSMTTPTGGTQRLFLPLTLR